MRLGNRRIRRQMLRLWKTPKAHETIPPAVYRELIEAATATSAQLQVFRRRPTASAAELEGLSDDIDTLIRIIKRHRPTH
jgi:hypothetical protein